MFGCSQMFLTLPLVMLLLLLSTLLFSTAAHSVGLGTSASSLNSFVGSRKLTFTSGVVSEKPIDELIYEGFNFCYEEPVNTPITSEDLLLACNFDPNSYVFVGLKMSASATTLSMGAYGIAEIVFSATATPSLHNGVYWYFNDRSFGFADIPNALFGDNREKAHSTKRLNWSMNNERITHQPNYNSIIRNGTATAERKVIYVQIQLPPNSASDPNQKAGSDVTKDSNLKSLDKNTAQLPVFVGPTKKPTPTTDAIAGNGGRMIGYLVGWKTPPPVSELVAAGYTHILVAFGVFSTAVTGQIIPAFDMIYEEYMASLKSSGLKVLLSIGGASTAIPHTTTSFNEVRVAAGNDATFSGTFVASVEQLMVQYGFDGIDIDIESGLGVGGTFNAPTGDIGVLAGILRTLHDNNPGILITLTPQTANVAANGGFDATWGNYASLIGQTYDILEWVGIQLYNTGCMFGIDGVCYENHGGGDQTFSVVMITNLLEDWPATLPGGQASGFQPYISRLKPHQIVLGYPSPNAVGASDGAPATRVAAIRNAIHCLSTGSDGCSAAYSPPRAYGPIGGVFNWEISYDQNNGYAFATGLKSCVVHGDCGDLTPTAAPSAAPSTAATGASSMAPSTVFQDSASEAPTYEATPREPSPEATESPTISTPQRAPTVTPSVRPTRVPTNKPSKTPSHVPTQKPSRSPTFSPTTRKPTLILPNSGVISDKPISELLSEGFTVCYEAPYDTPVTSTALTSACNKDPGAHLFVGSKRSAAATTLSIGAYGVAGNIFAPTSSSSAAFYHNGVYWYFYSYYSFGFADSSSVALNTADTMSGTKRLSWHIDVAYGGYRSGDTTTLNFDQTWRKVIYARSDSSPTVSPALSPTLFPTIINGGRMIGYLVGWKAPPPVSELVSAGYTHILVAFGVFSTSSPGQITSAFDTVTAPYIASLQTAGLKVLLSLGGASSSIPGTTVNFNQVRVAAGNDATFSATFVASVEQLMAQYGFDGIDIDIESGLGVGGTFNAPTGDIGVLAGILRTLYDNNNGILIALAPQTANIGVTSGFNSIWGNYAALIGLTYDILAWVGIQLYNSGCIYGLDGACYGSHGGNDQTFSVVMATDLLKDWPATLPGGQASGFQPYISRLKPHQIVLGYPFPNSAGVADGYPVTNLAAIRNAIQCLSTGSDGCSAVYSPPRAYGPIGGVFNWEISYDQNNGYAFATGLKSCVVHGDCGGGVVPTRTPSVVPTKAPTKSPSVVPTRIPSVFPTPQGQLHTGVKYNKPVAELVAEGFTVCYFTSYATATTVAALTSGCNTYPSSWIFVGSMSTADADTISLGAYGMNDAVFAETFSADIATLHNGVYWYMYPIKSFGFSDEPNVYLQSADTTSGAGRLSWHLDQGVGGYRSGYTMMLNSDTTWYKVVYVQTGPHPGFPTVAPTASSGPSAQPSLHPLQTPLPHVCPAYSTSRTNSATINYVSCNFMLCDGMSVVISGGNACSGDQFLRLYSYGSQLESNDDSAGNMCSKMTYTSPTFDGACEELTIRQGCYGGNTCSGVVTVTDGRTSQPNRSPTVQPNNCPTTRPTTRPTARLTVKPTLRPTARPTAQPTVVEETVVFSSELTLSGAASDEPLTTGALAVIEQAVANTMLLTDASQVKVTKYQIQPSINGRKRLGEQQTAVHSTSHPAAILSSTYDYIVVVLTTVDTVEHAGYSGNGAALYNNLRNRLEQSVSSGSFPSALETATVEVEQRLNTVVDTDFSELTAVVFVEEPTITPQTQPAEPSSADGSNDNGVVYGLSLAVVIGISAGVLLLIIGVVLIWFSYHSHRRRSPVTITNVPDTLESGAGGGTTANITSYGGNSGGIEMSRRSTVPVPQSSRKTHNMYSTSDHTNVDDNGGDDADFYRYDTAEPSAPPLPVAVAIAGQPIYVIGSAAIPICSAELVQDSRESRL